MLKITSALIANFAEVHLFHLLSLPKTSFFQLTFPSPFFLLRFILECYISSYSTINDSLIEEIIHVFDFIFLSTVYLNCYLDTNQSPFLYQSHT